MARTYITPEQAGDVMVSLGFDGDEVLPGERWFLDTLGGPDGRLDVVLGFEPAGGGPAMLWDGHDWEFAP